MRRGIKSAAQGQTMMRNRWVGRVEVSLLAGAGVATLLAWTVAGRCFAAQGEVTPESTPEITSFTPKQAAVGEEVKLTIEGKNFAPGVYVSFSTPAVHAVSTQRKKDNQLEVQILVGKQAQAGIVTLYVSNTASPVAAVPFTIVLPSGTPVPAPAPAASTATPAATQPAGQTTATPTPAAAPEVTRVDPPVGSRGGPSEVKITGKNFAKGAKVAFSNPGIHLLETQFNKDTELVAKVQVAADAQPGETSLFVINPDEEEAEAKWVLSEEVKSAPSAGASTPASTPAPAQPAAPAAKPAEAKAGKEPLQFEVYGLADMVAVLQTRNKAKGTLSLANGQLRFEESGKEVFSVPTSDVKEVEVNSLGGFNTGTFHVILKSGKTYHFMAASLRPADGQPIVDALKRGLK
jgi:hypothetical protein